MGGMGNACLSQPIIPKAWYERSSSRISKFSYQTSKGVEVYLWEDSRRYERAQAAKAFWEQNKKDKEVKSNIRAKEMLSESTEECPKNEQSTE